MFGWVRRFRSRDRGRAVFRFRDGRRAVSVDPIAVYVELQRLTNGQLAALCRAVEAEPPPGAVGETLERLQQSRFDATVRLADVVCRAFGVQPYADGRGMTIPERIALATSYMHYMAALKDAARPFSDGPSPTADSPRA